LGIAQELVTRLLQSHKSKGHIQDDNTSFTPFDQEALKFELETMLIQSGVHLLYHTVMISVEMVKNRIKQINLCNKSGVHAYHADMLIDATGDADVVAAAGIPFTKGHGSGGPMQPLTLMARFENVNKKKLELYAIAHRDTFPGMEQLDFKRPSIQLQGFVKEVARARHRGEWSIPRDDVLMFESSNPGEFYLNTTRVADHDATNAISLSDAETVGRAQAHELEMFLRKYIPGFEESWLAETGPNIGCRSSRQLVGLYTLTDKDVLAETKFSDAIAYSGYPIDIHENNGYGTDLRGLSWGGYYGIPLRCLLPQSVTNLIVCGRCISATFEAQASMRTTPTVAAIGQAAGVVAFLAASQARAVQRVEAAQVRRYLKKSGAFIV
jgi:hypothetical protein